MDGFERSVMFDGAVYGYHEVSSIEFYVGSYLIIQVRSWRNKSDKTNRPTDFHNTRLYIYQSSDTISMSNAYSYVENDAHFEEYIDENAQALEDILPILTDEQAELVPQVFPNWLVNTAYTVGYRCRYNDILYRCIQAHTSQEGWEPVNTPALWTRIGASTDIEEWIQPIGSEDAYQTGDKVTHNGSTWISDVDSNVWEPGVYGWSVVE